MVVLIKDRTDESQIENLVNWLKSMQLDVHVSHGAHQTILGLIGDTSAIDIDLISQLEIVESVKRIQEPYKNANKKFHPDPSVIDISGVKIGGGSRLLIAGPCSVESEEQIVTIARDVKAAGAGMLRGGAFKPRTSPYAFQGLGKEGIDMLLAARRETGLPIVTEVMDISQLKYFDDVDMI